MSDNYFRSLSDSECSIPWLTQAIWANWDIMSKWDLMPKWNYYIYPDNTEGSFSPWATIVANQVRLLLDKVIQEKEFIQIDETNNNSKKERLAGCKKYIKEHKKKYS